MGSTQDSDSVVYLTLREAAEETGASEEELRQAVRQHQIKGVKEDPENKRSRWLVALEDVRDLYGTELSESSESPSGTDFTEIPEPGVPPVEDDETVRDPDPMGAVLDTVGNQPRHRPSNQPVGVHPSMAVVVLDRGEELIERLAQAIEHFTNSEPEAPFDYQALLEKYVVAVEKGAEAEARAATLQNGIADLRDQTTTTAERLEQVQAQNLQLLAELEKARAEFDALLNRGSTDGTRPLWKRRNHR